MGQNVTISDYTGPYGVIGGHVRPYRAIRTIKEQTELYWTIQDNTVKNGIICQHKEPYNYTGPYGALWDHIGPNRTIRDHRGPYWAIQDHWESYWGI